MDATLILALRHGETAWNREGRLQGHLDLPLNERGRAQARLLGAALADQPLHAVYASDLDRAFTTAQAAQPLTVKVYNAGGNSFNVNSTLVYGEKEAMVIDAGFTRADALRIAANVLDSGKQLTTIYVSQADPDYYFGVETLKEIFPQADVVTTPAVLEKLSAKMVGKLSFWGPKMGANAPRKPVTPRWRLAFSNERRNCFSSRR